MERYKRWDLQIYYPKINFNHLKGPFCFIGYANSSHDAFRDVVTKKILKVDDYYMDCDNYFETGSYQIKLRKVLGYKEVLLAKYNKEIDEMVNKVLRLAEPNIQSLHYIKKVAKTMNKDITKLAKIHRKYLRANETVEISPKMKSFQYEEKDSASKLPCDDVVLDELDLNK